MTLHWPQITMIVLMALSVGISIAEHGRPRTPQNAWSSLIGAAMTIGLLYAGGFWG